MSLWVRAVAVGLAALLPTCAPPTAPPELAIEAVGRLERGLEVQLRVSRGRALVPPERVVLSAVPAGRVEIQGGGRIRLLEAGPVTVTAATEAAEGVVELTVSVPPTVFFDRRVGGNRDIYRAALDGRDVVRLTTNPGDDLDPTIAAGRVVFVSYRDGNAELYRVPVGGGPEERLTETAALELEPALSRDGARLAFTSDAAGTPRLWLADGDGRGAGPARPGNGASIEADPDWSPSGDRVAFMGTSGGGADLHVLRVAERDVERLTSEPSAEVEPTWSPAGDVVAFASDRGGVTSLHALEVASGTIRRLTDGAHADGQPAWLLDGRIVYAAFVDGTPRLRWIDPADPGAVHEVPVGEGAANPAAER